MPSGKTIEKGWVVPQPLGIALIVLVLGAIGWAYRGSTADNRETRDSIIRMETMLNERTRVFNEQQAKLEKKLEDEVKLASMYREDDAKEKIELRLSLKQRGIVISE